MYFLEVILLRSPCWLLSGVVPDIQHLLLKLLNGDLIWRECFSQICSIWATDQSGIFEGDCHGNRIFGVGGILCSISLYCHKGLETKEKKGREWGSHKKKGRTERIDIGGGIFQCNSRIWENKGTLALL